MAGLGDTLGSPWQPLAVRPWAHVTCLEAAHVFARLSRGDRISEYFAQGSAADRRLHPSPFTLHPEGRSGHGGSGGSNNVLLWHSISYHSSTCRLPTPDQPDDPPWVDRPKGNIIFQ
jgi:hypothetical protein